MSQHIFVFSFFTLQLKVKISTRELVYTVGKETGSKYPLGKYSVRKEIKSKYPLGKNTVRKEIELKYSLGESREIYFYWL